MGRIWDIIPPRPRRGVSKAVQKKRKNQKTSLFLALVMLIFVGFFIYSASRGLSSETGGIQTAPAPLKSPAAESISTAKTQEDLLIKILNGSGRSEETEQVASILTEAGYKLAKKENALNLYDETIIYYNPPYEKYAREIVSTLAQFQPKIQKFSQDSPYDLILLIGVR